MKSVISLSSLSLATALYPASSNVAVFPAPDFPDDEDDDEEDDDADCGEELDWLLLKLA